MELSVQLVIDVETLRDIVQFKSDLLKHQEDEIKFKRNVLIGNIKEALTDFNSIKYTLEKGFYLRGDDKSDFGIGGKEVKVEDNKCRVC